MRHVDPQRMLEDLRELRGSMIRYTRRLVEIETPTRDPEAQEAAFELLAGRLEELGFEIRRIPGERCGGSLYASPRRRRKVPPQLLLGHCDTVWPRGTLERMPVTVENGRMTGPGVYDMKAGLVQMLFALRALAEQGVDPPVPPVILINSDEETGSEETTPTIRRLARVSERAFVLEPSLGPTGKLKTARKGVLQYDVVARGEAAHAGLDPDAGASAILGLSHVVRSLFELNDPEAGVTVNVGEIEGGVRPNVVAPEATAVVDVRAPTREQAECIDGEIRGLTTPVPGVSLEVRTARRREPMERSPGTRRLWRAARRAASELGIEVEEGLAGGASDGNTTSQYTPTLDGLGAVGGGAHAEHEFVDLDAMVERAALLGLLLASPPVGRG